MSRLYNTLEKIRTGEPGGFSAKKSAPTKGTGLNADTSRKRRLVLLGAFAILGLVLAMFFAGPKRKEAKPPVTANTVATEAVTAPADAAAPERASNKPAEPAPQAAATQTVPSLPLVSLVASPAGTGDLYQQLNDTGLALIQENQHWRGIYYLEQARKQRPERPEALINMAVALAELGLRAPAKRLFSEAHALAPNHPMLRKNLELLGQADFFDPQWLSSLTAGQIPPGQSPNPQ